MSYLFSSKFLCTSSLSDDIPDKFSMLNWSSAAVSMNKRSDMREMGKK